MAVTDVRCAERQAIINAEQAAGRVYSAWQRFSLPWLAHRLDGSLRDPVRAVKEQ